MRRGFIEFQISKMAAKKKAAKPLPKTKMIDGKRYTKKSCGSTKAAAKKTAETHRAKGKNKYARVLKDPVTGKFCTFTRG